MPTGFEVLPRGTTSTSLASPSLMEMFFRPPKTCYVIIAYSVNRCSLSRGGRDLWLLSGRRFSRRGHF